MPILPLIALALILLLVTGVRVAQEYERSVVFRLGRSVGLRGPGLFWLIPFIETQRRVDLRTTTVDVERQEAITRDSVTIRINAVLWWRVVDPDRAVLAVTDYRQAVYQVALTALRNVIGQHDLDSVLRERDAINIELAVLVDAATEPWGVKVEAVGMKDVEIPEAMQRAMAREAEASREKRARIIKAQAELESARQLGEAAAIIAQNPIALELRRLQTVTEIGTENNSTTIMMMPTDFFTLASNLNQRLAAPSEAPKTPILPPPAPAPLPSPFSADAPATVSRRVGDERG